MDVVLVAADDSRQAGRQAAPPMIAVLVAERW
jgi:hypothetical protein